MTNDLESLKDYYSAITNLTGGSILTLKSIKEYKDFLKILFNHKK